MYICHDIYIGLTKQRTDYDIAKQKNGHLEPRCLAAISIFGKAIHYFGIAIYFIDVIKPKSLCRLLFTQ